MKTIYEQAAALPVRMNAKQIQILLIQTRSGDKWTIPKGVIDPGSTPQETALEEAYEEAGIEGVLHPEIFDTFSYSKWQGICQVQTFLMRVEKELNHWPEKYFRQRRWVDIDKIKHMIKYPSLEKVIHKLNIDRLRTIHFF